MSLRDPAGTFLECRLCKVRVGRGLAVPGGSASFRQWVVVARCWEECQSDGPVVWLVAVKVRAEVAAVGELLTREADDWKAAWRDWERAAERREREVERAERKVLLATGGLGVHGWRRACERQRFRTVEDARSKAKAIRGCHVLRRVLQ